MGPGKPTACSLMRGATGRADAGFKQLLRRAGRQACQRMYVYLKMVMRGLAYTDSTPAMCQRSLGCQAPDQAVQVVQTQPTFVHAHKGSRPMYSVACA